MRAPLGDVLGVQYEIDENGEMRCLGCRQHRPCQCDEDERASLRRRIAEDAARLRSLNDLFAEAK